MDLSLEGSMKVYDAEKRKGERFEAGEMIIKGKYRGNTDIEV